MSAQTQRKYKKTHPHEHYEWPLRRVVKVIRNKRQHIDILACGHKFMWRGSSPWKQGENIVTTQPRMRRCPDCFAEEKKRLEDDLATV